MIRNILVFLVMILMLGCASQTRNKRLRESDMRPAERLQSFADDLGMLVSRLDSKTFDAKRVQKQLNDLETSLANDLGKNMSRTSVLTYASFLQYLEIGPPSKGEGYEFVDWWKFNCSLAALHIESARTAIHGAAQMTFLAFGECGEGAAMGTDNFDLGSNCTYQALSAIDAASDKIEESDCTNAATHCSIASDFAAIAVFYLSEYHNSDSTPCNRVEAAIDALTFGQNAAKQGESKALICAAGN